MTYTEIKKRNDKRYYYRVKSIRKGKKVEKQRIYLGANLNKEQLKKLEEQATKKLATKHIYYKEEIKEGHNEKITFNINKNKNFYKWYTDIVQKEELADLRSNIKEAIDFQP